MSTCIDINRSWSIGRTNTCDVPSCCRQPVIMAGGRCHQPFRDLDLEPAADRARHFPTFPGWYHFDHVTTSSKSQVTVTVHPLAS